MDEKQIDAHIQEIARYQKLLDSTPKENKRKRIELLSEQIQFIGKLAAEFSADHKEAYVARKQATAEAEDEAPKHKQTAGEVAAVPWRKREAEAFRNMERWKNAFTSTKELIHALKFDINIDIADGTISNKQREG